MAGKSWGNQFGRTNSGRGLSLLKLDAVGYFGKVIQDSEENLRLNIRICF